MAEIESGSSDITLEVPYEEFDRLKKVKGLSGVATPISDIGMIFITNKEPMLDKNVRLAAIMAIDKKAIVDRLLRGYGVPIETLEAPEYSAFDPVDQDALRSQEGEGAACSFGLLAGEAGQVHDPDDPRPQAERL